MTAPNLARVQWRKSSYSDSNGGACIEVSFVDHAVGVRDSKNAADAVLAFPAADWRRFLAHVAR